MPDEDDNNLYNGERGPAWRKYRRDMLSTARGKFSKNDKYSFKQAMLGTDEGGVDPAAPAMPAAAAALSIDVARSLQNLAKRLSVVPTSIS